MHLIMMIILTPFIFIGGILLAALCLHDGEFNERVLGNYALYGLVLTGLVWIAYGMFVF